MLEEELFVKTPVEEYEVQGVQMYVKREDLCSPYPMPPLSKMRGVFKYIQSMKDSVKGVGILDTRVSKSGQGVAVICEELDLGCRYYVPVLKDQVDPAMQWQIARDHGAEIISLAATRNFALRAKATKDCAEHEYLMLPQGLPLYETVLATGDVIRAMSPELLRGTVMVATGTGTIMAGLIKGLMHMAVEPARIIGVSASMSTEKQEAVINKHLSRAIREWYLDQQAVDKMLSRLVLLRAKGDYYTPGENVTPWPSHPYYEWKAMDVLRPYLEGFPKPILFWNIGSL